MIYIFCITISIKISHGKPIALPDRGVSSGKSHPEGVAFSHGSCISF
jgi:hypothetical protein